MSENKKEPKLPYSDLDGGGVTVTLGMTGRGKMILELAAKSYGEDKSSRYIKRLIKEDLRRRYSEEELIEIFGADWDVYLSRTQIGQGLIAAAIEDLLQRRMAKN